MQADQRERLTWDAADFEVMGWHDATIWAFHANTDDYELLFDIDYIFKWVPPGPGETYFKFWVAPATMVFHDVCDVHVELDSSQGALEIAGLHREHPTLTPNGELTQYTYRFECQEGEIKLCATGFTMFVRRPPMLLNGQRLGLLERGGVRFERARLPAKDPLEPTK